MGIDKVFWGVIESRHLVDYINQTDGVEDVDGEDKLGQPMINLGLQRDWGDLIFFCCLIFVNGPLPARTAACARPLWWMATGRSMNPA